MFLKLKKKGQTQTITRVDLTSLEVKNNLITNLNFDPKRQYEYRSARLALH